jgi:hypothetical protein
MEELIYKKIVSKYYYLSSIQKQILFYIYRFFDERNWEGYNSLAVSYIIKPHFTNSIIVESLSEPENHCIHFEDKFIVLNSELDSSIFSAVSTNTHMNPSLVFKKERTCKYLKETLNEVLSSKKVCLQCKDEKLSIYFSNECKSVCITCPKVIPKSSKEKTTFQWMKSLPTTLQTIKSSANPLPLINTLMDDLEKRRDELKKYNVDVDKLLNEIHKIVPPND